MHHKAHLVAVNLLHLGHQMADAIRQPQIDRLRTDPDIGVEQVGVRQAVAAPRLDMGDEGLMDRRLDRL